MISDMPVVSGGRQSSDNRDGSISFREDIDRMVDRAALEAGLDPMTARILKACNAVL